MLRLLVAFSFAIWMSACEPVPRSMDELRTAKATCSSDSDCVFVVDECNCPFMTYRSLVDEIERSRAQTACTRDYRCNGSASGMSAVCNIPYNFKITPTCELVIEG